ERVGFRYCLDKALRASAAAVYWHTIENIHQQRPWPSDCLEELPIAHHAVPFSLARQTGATQLLERETAVFPHYSLLEGHDRFTPLPQATAREFQPLHQESSGFPSPVELLTQIGAREWFAPLSSRADGAAAQRYCVEQESLTLPALALQVIDRRE